MQARVNTRSCGRSRNVVEVVCSTKKQYTQKKYGDQRKRKAPAEDTSPFIFEHVQRIDTNSSVPVSKQIRAVRTIEESEKRQESLKRNSAKTTSYRKKAKTAEEVEEEQKQLQKKYIQQGSSQRTLHSAFRSWTLPKPDQLYVDGYNFIHRDDKLSQLIKDVDLGESRRVCEEKFGEYMHLREIKITLVYDATEGPPYPPYPDKRETRKSGLQVIYTTQYDADTFICTEVKRMVQEKEARGVFVATSDSIVQTFVRSNGGYIVGVNWLLQDIKKAKKELRQHLQLQDQLALVRSHRGIRAYCNQQQLEDIENMRNLLPARRS